MPEARFRAILKGSFELRGRGTVLCVDILEGVIRAGDMIVVPLADGGNRTIAVRSIGALDVDRPAGHALVALMVGDLRSSEVAVDRELLAAPA